jgi:hypothetical protein
VDWVAEESEDKLHDGLLLRQSDVGVAFLSADQRFCRQHRLHHEPSGAGIHHADGA